MSIKLKDTILDYIDKAYKDSSGNVISSTYLPKSGGTLTSSSVPLTISRTGGNNSSISYAVDNVNVGILGFNSDGVLVVRPDYQNNTNYYNIIHSGNIGSQSVSSATKLQTARTLWGQSFNGTANVTGSLSNVANISMTGNITGAGSIELSGTTTPFIDFHYNKSEEDYTSRIIEGLSGQLTVTGKLRVGLSYTTSTDYKFYVNGSTFIGGATALNSSLSVAGASSFSGAISASQYLHLTGTDSTTAMLKFSRSSVNYIIFPSDGSIGFATAAGAANISVRIDSTGIRPYSVSTTRETFLGDATYRWAGTYSVLGNFSGLITASGGIKLNTIQAPTSSGGTTYGPGTNGQVLKSNGTTVYWASDNNTNTKVTQTVTTSNAEYPILLAPNGQTATATTTSYFDSGVTLNPSTNVISASISGNAATASKLGTSTLGGTYQPIYLSSGTATAGTSYAKAIKGITRSGTTFTYTCIDGTTGTFSQQDTVGTSYASSKSAQTAATAGWYRVATTASGIKNCVGIFEVVGAVSGKHTTAILTAGTSYGQTTSVGINVLSCHQYGSGICLSKARIVYHTTYSSNYAYLEVYLNPATATTISVKLVDGSGWTLVDPNTAGSVPEGYSSKEIELTTNSISTTGSLNTTILNIPTSSGGTTLGPGSSGQVLKSNGSTVYWASDNNSNTWRAIQANGTQIASTGTGTYALNFVSGTGITVAGTAGTSSAANKITITNAGVRSAAINGNYLRINTNGTNADLTIPYATLAGTLEYKNLPSSTTTTANTGWCKFATLTYNSRAWDSVQGYLFVSGVESNDSLGILYYHFRAGSTATTHSVSAFYWLIKNKDVTSVIAVKTADNVLDLYINNSGTYESIRLYHMSDMSGNFAWNVGTWTTTKPTVAFEATLVGRVNHSASADSVAWANVTGRPTITNYYWADQKITSSASYVTPSFTGVNIFESSSKTNRISINWNSTTGSASSIARIYAIDNAGSSYRDLSIGKTSGALYYDASADSWGIGTTTPSYKLHISGGLGATGAASLGSTLSVSGATTLGGAVNVKNSTGNPCIYFQDSSVGNTMGTIYDFVSISDGAYTNSRFMFRQYSYTSGTTTRSSYYENYYLPQTAADLTASASYYILTTKNTAVSGDGGSTWGSSITVKINGTSKTLTIPANPNTDTKVTQTNSTGNADYRVLFSVTADDTTRTEGARKSTNLKFNPSTGTLTATTFSGKATKVACTATTDNVDRPIVLTNTSSSLYYTTKATINYSDGHIKAGALTSTGAITSSLTTSTHINGNKGVAIINSTAAAGYNMLAKMNSTNGVFTIGAYSAAFNLYYTAKTTIDAGTNGTTKTVTLLNESGNSTFPGTVTATTFSGALSGNATTATTASKLSTVSKTAWGQTYWTSGGIPTNISGDMTGVGNITINANNNDRFINFYYSEGAKNSWRIGYLGTGTGDANYLVFQSNKSDGASWVNALQLGCTTLNAVFGGSVTATSLIGPLNNTLTFAAGTFSATSYNNGSAVTVNIPTSKSHVGLGNVQNTAFYKRVTTINGTGWDMAGTANSAAFTIYAPTTAGTSGQYLVSSGGTPSWITMNPYDANISRTANTVLAAPNGSSGSATFRTLVAADIPNLAASKITSGTLGVARGGTGATTFTSGAALIGAGTGAVTTRSITNMTSVGYINYNTNLMTTNTLAYWNGAYSSGNGSNLAYCNRGAFGTIVTKNTGDYATASHTHSYAGSSSAGGAATSSNKVNFQAIGSLDFNAMVGDTYRGTFWYGGGSNTAVNNPLGEGTAFGMVIWRNASGYTNQMIMSSSGRLYLRNYSSSSWADMKTVAFTSDIPSSLKCPSSLTIQANGTSLGSYDGSSAKTFNITYSNVGAAAASHTHSYAGSSSAGGAASTVVCSEATSNTDRPIVGTNKSNQIYYTTKTTVNWSTGKITAPTINLNVAAGTAPISCTSTTVCTNLNAGLWDGYHLSVVSTLPSSPGSTTIYFVTG